VIATLVTTILYGLAVLGALTIFSAVCLFVGVRRQTATDRREAAVAEQAWLDRIGIAAPAPLDAADYAPWLDAAAFTAGTVGLGLVGFGAAVLITLLPGQSPFGGWLMVIAGGAVLVLAREVSRRSARAR